MTSAGSKLAGLTLLSLVGLRPIATMAAEPAGSATAQESLALCDHADELSGAEQQQALTRGLQLAEAAVAADRQDAKAHLAVSCNLGKRMALSGFSVDTLLSIRRLRRELDATLELAPNDADALAAKGALLLQLPRLLGGDAAEAERLLRRALAAEPQHRQARRYLAEALVARGARAEAEALAASQ